MNKLPILIALVFFSSGLCAQSERAISIDVAPLLDRIFSDDIGADPFRFDYFWIGERSVSNLSFKPNFFKTSSEQNGATFNDLTEYDLGLSFFYGKRSILSNKISLVMGSRMGYTYSRSESKQEQNDFGGGEFNRTRTSHLAQLGPELMFWYKIGNRLQLGTSIGAPLSYFIESENISFSGFPDGSSQEVTTFSLDLSPPNSIQLLFLLNKSSEQ